MINLTRGFAPTKVKFTKEQKDENHFIIESLLQDIRDNGGISCELMEIIEEILQERIYSESATQNTI